MRISSRSRAANSTWTGRNEAEHTIKKNAPHQGAFFSSWVTISTGVSSSDIEHLSESPHIGRQGE